MNQTQTLTPDLIATMCEKDQIWLFRSLILLTRYMEADIAKYRESLGKIDNRNSPRYWLDWMSRSLLNRTMTLRASYLAVPATIDDPKWFTERGRVLSNTHLQSAIDFIKNDSVKQTVYDLATGKIALPPLK